MAPGGSEAGSGKKRELGLPGDRSLPGPGAQAPEMGGWARGPGSECEGLSTWWGRGREPEGMASWKSWLPSQGCVLEMGTLPRELPGPITRTFFSPPTKSGAWGKLTPKIGNS